ncbi:hypothetical protein [Cryptosporangium phraense]|uniref:Uncharacterized protein n=1 Tax=Cryptosporangium phraense TaxID=2593070 RepID=A0A545AJH3_9ACTN|nr:hypothetical protein [Cryptosporangium phraense]TQS41474.1 hypothetical protein FL583_29680 [Cryptosporangium phraense]
MTPSELDQLADYAEGLLDGTPDADVVAGRIADDQEWADAYRQLTAVTTALGDLPDVSMPDDVAMRLDAALAAEPPLQPTAQPAARAAETDEDGPAGPWVASDPSTDRLSAQRARRERATRIGQWIAAAAAVVAIGFCGVSVVRSNALNSDDSATTSSAGDSKAGPSVLSAPSAPRSVHVSGISYSVGELGPQARAMLSGPTEAAASPRAPGPSTEAAPAPASSAAYPAALRRLRDPAELAGCLGALGLGEPLAVDYATLEGAPAIVIVTPDADPNQLVVVAAGADCGVGGAGDERARATVAR